MKKTGKIISTLVLSLALCAAAVAGFVPQPSFAAPATSFAPAAVPAAAAKTALDNIVHNNQVGDSPETTEDEVTSNPNNPFRVIEEPDTPKSIQQRIENWSLLDLVMAASSLVLMIVLIVGGLITHIGAERPKRMPLRLLSIVPAVTAALLFFNTQDLSLPMSLFDDVTVWFALCTVISILLAMAANHRPSQKKLHNIQTIR